MANQFSIDPLGGYKPGQGLRQALSGRDARDEQRQLAAQRQKMQEAMQGAATGDPDAIDNLFAINPDLASKYENRLFERQKREGMAANSAKVEAEGNWAIKAKRALDSGDEVAFSDLIIEAESNRLIDYDSTMMGKDPREDQLVVNTMLYKWMGKDAYKELVGGEAAKKSDLPAESIAFNDLIKDFTPKEKKIAKRVKAGLKGRAMSNAVLSAIESGEVKNLKDAMAEIKQSEKFAAMTGASRAKTIDKGFESIVKIDAGIRNIDRAISVLDKGAGVGAVEKIWPSIRAASVELDNIRGQMALDVVGATTFGALSKGELDLAKDIALPTGLDTEELKDYLNKKKIAQEKLRSYYNEQIQFLDQGGTVAGFLRMKEKSQGQQGTSPQQDTLSDEDLLLKYGG